MIGKILHQFMMVILDGKSRLEPPEFMPKVHLGTHQGNRSPVADAMEGDHPGAHRNVLEVTHHQIALGIQCPGGVVHR